MRKVPFLIVTLFLVGAIHLEWHLARPTHHRLSLGWSEHWLFAVAAFAMAGWIIARTWPRSAVKSAVSIVALSLLLAQGLEPFLEVLFYERRLGYPLEPERWRVFFAGLAAGIPSMAIALWFCRRRQNRTSSSAAPAQRSAPAT